MIKNYLILACFLAGTSLVHAHARPKDVKEESSKSPSGNSGSMVEVTVSGTVKAEDGSPLPAVNVIEKGTSSGTATDANGKYVITVTDGNATLIFSFIGYATQQVPVKDRTTIDISLQPDLAMLNEIVVIGYGTQLKKDVTGAISTVKSDEIAKRPLVRLEQALQGTAAGVVVTSQNGQPGQGLRVKIRGANSITGSTEPLYVIDGSIGSGSDVNVSDVESIEVLKDAASAAIYGSRGSNGVVLITTKSGKSGKMKINVESWVQKAMMPKKLDLMNAYDFARSVNNQFSSTGQTPPFSASDLQSRHRLAEGTS